ncbi:hypothetical protein K0U83_02705 [bacterium]|nr:hypothetical protein [bacterium]
MHHSIQLKSTVAKESEWKDASGVTHTRKSWTLTFPDSEDFDHMIAVKGAGKVFSLGVRDKSDGKLKPIEGRLPNDVWSFVASVNVLRGSHFHVDVDKMDSHIMELITAKDLVDLVKVRKFEMAERLRPAQDGKSYAGWFIDMTVGTRTPVALMDAAPKRLADYGKHPLDNFTINNMVYAPSYATIVVNDDDDDKATVNIHYRIKWISGGSFEDMEEKGELVSSRYDRMTDADFAKKDPSGGSQLEGSNVKLSNPKGAKRPRA